MSKPPRPVNIVAASHVQAREHALRYKIWPWRHITDRIQLQGIENPEVIFLPGWKQLADAEGIVMVIRTMRRGNEPTG